jgi:hypothetical protein
MASILPNGAMIPPWFGRTLRRANRDACEPSGALARLLDGLRAAGLIEHLDDALITRRQGPASRRSNSTKN